ncbi:MAG: hypothetical protein JO023_03010 [Chloroflexi bacterium]|nr:hypothetical protein [Chloroflexota bacterium]
MGRQTALARFGPSVCDDLHRTYLAECSGIRRCGDENASGLDLSRRSSTPLPGDAMTV